MAKLESIRKRLGVSRADVAHAAGISQQTIYLYETGRQRGKAGVAIQRAIAAALGVKPAVLFGKGGKAR